MNPSYNNGNGSNAGGQTGQPGGIFSRNESTGGTTGASGAAGVPGAKPGVIASGPDPVNMPDEKPAGLSLGSNRHLFRKPRAQAPRNFVMNVGGGAGAGMGAGAGRKSGGPKKGLIIGGLAVVVVMVVVLVVFLVMRGGGGTSSTRTDVSFNDLINYITTGKESKSDIDSEYSITNDYYFLDGWNTQEEKNAIYNKTKQLMDGFVANYKDGDNGVLNNLVKSTKDLFDFVYAMNSKEKIYGIESTMTIIKEGDEKGKQKLVDHFVFFDLNNNNYAENFSELYSDYIDALINKVKIYRDNGCISGNYIDEECIKGKTTETFEDLNKYYLDMTRYYNLAENFVGNIYNINSLLHGKTIMGENDE
jgi:hypothetical protein